MRSVALPRSQPLKPQIPKPCQTGEALAFKSGVTMRNALEVRRQKRSEQGRCSRPPRVLPIDGSQVHVRRGMERTHKLHALLRHRLPTFLHDPFRGCSGLVDDGRSATWYRLWFYLAAFPSSVDRAHEVEVLGHATRSIPSAG